MYIHETRYNPPSSRPDTPSSQLQPPFKGLEPVKPLPAKVPRLPACEVEIKMQDEMNRPVKKPLTPRVIISFASHHKPFLSQSALPDYQDQIVVIRMAIRAKVSGYDYPVAPLSLIGRIF